MKKNNGLGKFVLGAALGASLGMLFAPKTGVEARKDLKKKANELLNKAKDIDIDEVKKTVEAKTDEIMMELQDLDKEKALKIVKTKSKEIQKKASDLVDYAIEKGTPALEKAAKSLKEKVIVVTKDILNKLEQEEK